LGSANGIFVNGEKVPSTPVFAAVKVRLGIYGPFVEFELAPQAAQPIMPLGVQPLGTQAPPQQSTQYTPPQTGDTSSQKSATHYFGNPDDKSIGEHTRMVRRAFADVQTKQKRKYGGVIAALVLCAMAAGGYAFYLHQQNQKNRVIAEAMFYSMKDIDINIANVEKMVEASGNAQGAAQVAQMRSQRKALDEQYNHLLASLKVYDPKMTEEQKLILRVARIFGECEVAMPPQFLSEVENYIKKWQSTGGFTADVKLANNKGYTRAIAREFLDKGLPPQFFYLAMRESNFDEMISGPKTYMGYAKGMWQFIPSTAEHYGLKVGPLVDLPRPDPGDDRHHWDRATKAAASYIKDLYGTDAQASGLLVMACYNWGEGSVLPLVRSMPKNPRERNFWKLIELYRKKIPDETYDYVYYIFAAAVIGENPKLFGMDVDNPLEGM
jgi:membrane-bound lytic murein transglycosylase D